jgi:hypothetical protein
MASPFQIRLLPPKCAGAVFGAGLSRNTAPGAERFLVLRQPLTHSAVAVAIIAVVKLFPDRTKRLGVGSHQASYPVIK